MVVFGYDWLQMVGSGCLHSYFSLSLVVFGCLWVPLVVNGFNLHLWSFFGDNCVIILCLFICFENQNAKSFQFFLSDCQCLFDIAAFGLHNHACSSCSTPEFLLRSVFAHHNTLRHSSLDMVEYLILSMCWPSDDLLPQ